MHALDNARKDNVVLMRALSRGRYCSSLNGRVQCAYVDTRSHEKLNLSGARKELMRFTDRRLASFTSPLGRLARRPKYIGAVRKLVVHGNTYCILGARPKKRARETCATAGGVGQGDDAEAPDGDEEAGAAAGRAASALAEFSRIFLHVFLLLACLW